MKRFFMIIMLTVILLPFQSIKAEENISNEWNSLKNRIAQLICESDDYCGELKLKLSKERIYNITLQDYGKIVYFEDKNNSDIVGYVIFKGTTNDLLIVEYGFGEYRPFIYEDLPNIMAGIGEQYEGVLIDHGKGVYYDYEFILHLMNVSEVDVEMMLSSALDTAVDTTDTVTYFYDSANIEVTTVNNYPHMDQSRIADESDTPSSRTTCSTVAGLSLITFYEGLYPDSSSLSNVYNTSTGDYYIWGDYRLKSSLASEKAELISIFNDLYDYMDTDDYILGTSFPGTAHSKFYDGMVEYYDLVGYDVVVDEIIGDVDTWVEMTNESLSTGDRYNTYKNSIDNNTPVVIQLGGLLTPMYQTIDIDDYTSAYTRPGPYGTTFYFRDRTYEYRSQLFGLHTVVGYGYMEESLHDIDPYGYTEYPALREKKYIVISTWGGKRYFNVRDITVSQAYTFNILKQNINPGGC